MRDYATPKFYQWYAICTRQLIHIEKQEEKRRREEEKRRRREEEQARLDEEEAIRLAAMESAERAKRIAAEEKKLMTKDLFLCLDERFGTRTKLRSPMVFE